MTKRRGFAVNISNRIMLTPQEAALGADEGPEFLFVLYMGEDKDAKAYYFDRRGLDKLCRTFRRTEYWVKREIDGIISPTPEERLITALKDKKNHLQKDIAQIDVEITRLKNVLDDTS